MSKYTEYIKEKLDSRELLEQLAEESAELTQAALKLIRASGNSNNTTPTSLKEAEDNFVEEMNDVLAVLHLTVAAFPNCENYWKYERWAKRLGYTEEQDE